VEVVLGGERVVPAALRVVRGAGECPQGQGVDEPLLRPALDLRQHPLQRARRQVLEVALELDPELREDRRQLDELGRRRPLVDAEQRRLPPELEHARHALVGGDHELLDEPMGEVVLRGPHADHEARGIEQYLRLRQVEVDRSARRPPSAEPLGCLCRQRQRTADVLFEIVGPCSVLEPGAHLGVRAASPHPDHPALGAVPLHPALGRDEKPHRERQSVHPLAQRAELARQRLRQHRHAPPRQVHRGAAFPRRGVDSAVRPHVVRHIGDVHEHLDGAPTVLERRHRVVVIARRLGVDRHRRLGAEVPSALDLVREHLSGQRRRLGERSGRHLDRDTRLGQHHLLGHPRLLGEPQAAQEPALEEPTVPELAHRHLDEFPLARRRPIPRCQQHPRLDPTVEWQHHRLHPVGDEPPHHRQTAPFEHPHHLPVLLGHQAALHALVPAVDEHLIAVERSSEALGGDHDVGQLGLDDPQHTVPRCGLPERPAIAVGELHRGDAPGAASHHLAAGLELGQRGLHVLACGFPPCPHPELAHQARRRRSVAFRLPYQLEHVLPSDLAHTASLPGRRNCRFC